ncbi:AAA family ATPase [Aliivibrio fischeri]|uniref:AAA family ATPase n=1 Tax=Aliivibrio fischeri TaxID=668 RepID=UPI0012DAD89F|nr:DUF3696 domain-containing protein [Aliivibrio fischeri]MUK70325.1 DUF3696 domain-containing protein [Aliivibrio fischeri]MUK72011.1 DUF3696 domain-containing protein [Aliivibrio fischeri]
MITKLRLRNFKCYKDKSFSFSNLTVFCGNNSVGKSTAIQSLLMAIQSNFSKEGISLKGDFISIGTYDDLHKRNEEEDSIFFEIGNDNGLCSWGYDLDDFDAPHYDEEGYDQRKALMKHKPLGLIRFEGDGCNSIIESLKDDFQYLSAERLGPKSNYPYSIQRRSKNWLGVQGEYSAQVLSTLTLSGKELGELSEGDVRKHPTAIDSRVAHNIFEWLGVVSPGAFVDSTSIEHADIATSLFEFDGQKFRPINVGFGLSYSLPIIMALLMAKPGGLVIIENPEAHLHPKGQSYLGRLIALTAQSGVQVIIETHSDHIINGMRIMPRLKLVDPSIFTIYQISKGEEQSNVDRILIDEQGQLTEWPSEFFDQQLIDMNILMSGIDV